MENMEIIIQDVSNVVNRLGIDIHQLEGKTILITGAAGFLCSYFVDVVAYANDNVFKSPCTILALDNLKTGKASNLTHLEGKSWYTFTNHDITKPFAYEGDIHFIIHGASIASPTFYRKYPLATMDVNVIGTRNMLDLAKQKESKSLIHISTSEVYGDPYPQFIPTTEEYKGNVSCIGPRACYDESKRFGETLAVLYHQQFGVPVKISRPFNSYGPRLHLHDRRVVPDLLRDAIAGKDVVLLSDGTPTRSFCYVEDTVFGHFVVLFKGENGEPYNVGNSNEISMKTLAETITAVVNPELKVVVQPSSDKNYHQDSPQRRCPDTAKIERLGFATNVQLEEGIKRTVRWHLAQPP